MLRDLRSTDKDRRLLAIEHAASWAELDDPEIVDVVFGMLGKELDDDNRKIIQVLAAMPRATDRLNEMIAGNEYPEDFRSQVVFSHARARQEKPIELHVTAIPLEEYDRFAVAVTLKNTSDRRVSFTYRRPEEFIAIEVAIESSDDGHASRSVSLAPKPEIRWLSATNRGEATEITLDPGQSEIVRLELTDYFKFPSCRGKASFACRLPGVHRSPQLAEGNVSFSILSLDTAQTEPKKGAFEKAMELEKQGR